jgi:Cdc6-like AAA superfamily ATPase
MSDVDYQGIALRLTKYFRPSAAINSEELFQGRTAQVRQVVDAINQPGRHAIIYGGRGVGKTSLAQILPFKLRGRELVPIIAPYITCDSSDDYSTLWFKVFSEIEEQTGATVLNDASRPSGIGGESTPEFDAAAIFDWTPFEVRRHLEPIGRNGILYVILDEFNSVSPEVRQLFADTIKLLSDRASPVTLIAIGVSDNVTGLIHDHRSIERCLAQIHMPRMKREELEQIVKLGHEKVGMMIEPNALDEITGLSKGLPTYTHLLALNSSRNALDHESLTVNLQHVKQAMETSICETEESIRTEYDIATYSPKKTALHTKVLLACAMADTDEFGRFQPPDLVEPLQKITGQAFTTDRFSVHLKQFSSEEKGGVLKKTGSEYKWRYQFENPLLQPYVLMRGLASGVITDEQLDLSTQVESRYPLFKKK